MSYNRPTLIHKDHKIISRSKNLRGILAYARRRAHYGLPIGVRNVIIFPHADHSATLFVRFNDGASSVLEFASYLVACGWIKSRRSWGLLQTTSNHGLFALYAGEQTDYARYCQTVRIIR